MISDFKVASLLSILNGINVSTVVFMLNDRLAIAPGSSCAMVTHCYIRDTVMTSDMPEL